MASNKDSKVKTVDFGRNENKNGFLMIGTIVILVLTIVSFVIVPAISGAGGGQSSFTFGKFGSEKIEYSSDSFFAREVERINNLYRDSMTIDDNLMDFMHQTIWRMAYEQAVLQASIISEMKKAGYEPSTQALDRAMVERGAFFVNGEFSEESYRNTSAARKLSLKNQYYQDIMGETFVNDVFYGQLRSKESLDFIMDLGKVSKNFNYAVFSRNDYPEEKVREFADNNEKLFEMIKLQRITVDTEKSAQNIISRLESGEGNFGDIALTLSKDSYAENQGNMDWGYYYQLLKELSAEDTDRLFALAQDEVFGPVETEYGWLIYKVQEKGPNTTMDRASFLEDVKAYLSYEEVGVLEDYALLKAESFIADIPSSGFVPAAESLGIEQGETGFFTLNLGGDQFLGSNVENVVESEAFSGASYSEDFYTQAFSLKSDGSVSDPIIVGSNIIVLELIETVEGEGIPEEYMPAYRSQIVNQMMTYKQDDLKNVVLASEELKDNFYKTYAKLFNSGN